jgi:hypothetical protein
MGMQARLKQRKRDLKALGITHKIHETAKAQLAHEQPFRLAAAEKIQPPGLWQRILIRRVKRAAARDARRNDPRHLAYEWWRFRWEMARREQPA